MRRQHCYLETSPPSPVAQLSPLVGATAARKHDASPKDDAPRAQDRSYATPCDDDDNNNSVLTGALRSRGLMNAHLEELFSKPRQVRAARRALQQHMRALLEEAKQPRQQKTQQGRASTRDIHRWIAPFRFPLLLKKFYTSFTDRPHK